MKAVVAPSGKTWAIRRDFGNPHIDRLDARQRAGRVSRRRIDNNLAEIHGQQVHGSAALFAFAYSFLRWFVGVVIALLAWLLEVISQIVGAAPCVIQVGRRNRIAATMRISGWFRSHRLRKDLIRELSIDDSLWDTLKRLEVDYPTLQIHRGDPE